MRFGIGLEKVFNSITEIYRFVPIYFIRLGATIQSTLDEEQTSTHAKVLSELTKNVSSIVGMLNQDDELTFLRIRSKQREIMVCTIQMDVVFMNRV